MVFFFVQSVEQFYEVILLFVFFCGRDISSTFQERCTSYFGVTFWNSVVVTVKKFFRTATQNEKLKLGHIQKTKASHNFLGEGACFLLTLENFFFAQIFFSPQKRFFFKESEQVFVLVFVFFVEECWEQNLSFSNTVRCPFFLNQTLFPSLKKESKHCVFTSQRCSAVASIIMPFVFFSFFLFYFREQKESIKKILQQYNYKSKQ